MHLGNRDPRPNEILELDVTVPMHILICIYVPALCPLRGPLPCSERRILCLHALIVQANG
jgi:hypothetical protein